MTIQADKSLKYAFAGEQGVAADFVDDGKLKQTGGDEQEQKTQPVFGDGVGPKDQLAAALRERHENHARTQCAQHAGQRRQRRLLERRHHAPGWSFGHALGSNRCAAANLSAVRQQKS